jgi:predicted nucleic acid-binding protein
VIAADTSIVVAAALEWHDHHQIAKETVGRVTPRLPASVVIESYSVLTRLPDARRVSSPVAREFLRRVFPSPPLTLHPDRLEELLDLSVRRQIVGGSIYDAVVAATAVQEGAELLTLDRRAIRTYELLGLDYRLLI